MTKQAYCSETDSSGQFRFRLLPLTALCSWPVPQSIVDCSLVISIILISELGGINVIDCEVLSKIVKYLINLNF